MDPPRRRPRKSGKPSILRLPIIPFLLSHSHLNVNRLYSHSKWHIGVSYPHNFKPTVIHRDPSLTLGLSASRPLAALTKRMKRPWDLEHHLGRSERAFQNHRSQVIQSHQRLFRYFSSYRTRLRSPPDPRSGWVWSWFRICWGTRARLLPRIATFILLEPLQ